MDLPSIIPLNMNGLVFYSLVSVSLAEGEVWGSRKRMKEGKDITLGIELLDKMQDPSYILNAISI